MRALITGDCWEWGGWKNAAGYSQKKIKGERHYVHRLAWIWANGRWNKGVPEGKQVNHHCDNPSCVNPDHLYLGTQQENIEDRVNRNPKKTHCKRGHKFSDENTYITSAGSRMCRTCSRARNRAYKERVRLCAL